MIWRISYFPLCTHFIAWLCAPCANACAVSWKVIFTYFSSFKFAFTCSERAQCQLRGQPHIGPILCLLYCIIKMCHLMLPSLCVLPRGSYSAAQLCSVIGDSKDMALIRDPALSSLEVATDDSDTASRGNSPRMKRKHLLAHSHSQPLVQSHSSSLDESRGGTLTFSLDEDMLRDAFRNPPSDRHLPPEAMRGRKSLPSVSYDKNCKRWFWQKRNGSVSHCTRSGYREPTLRQWLKDVQRTFKKRGKKHRNRIKGERMESMFAILAKN